MNDKLLDKLESLDAIKWLKYGFAYITNIQEANPEIVITFLRYLYNYSDEDIIELATKRCYTPFGSYIDNTRRKKI